MVRHWTINIVGAGLLFFAGVVTALAANAPANRPSVKLHRQNMAAVLSPSARAFDTWGQATRQYLVRALGRNWSVRARSNAFLSDSTPLDMHPLGNPVRVWSLANYVHYAVVETQGGWSLAPFVGLTYGGADIPPYRGGPAGLTSHMQRINYVRLAAALQLEKQFTFYGHPAGGYISAGVVQYAGDRHIPGAGSTVTFRNNRVRRGVMLNAGVASRINRQASLGLYYSGERGRRNVSNHTLSVGMDMGF